VNGMDAFDSISAVTVPEFTHDLACAQQEYRAKSQPSAQMGPECSAKEKSLSAIQRAD
jgi:hypothetical protein